MESEDKLRRAAILVLSLDDATADLVLAGLGAEDAARVRRIMVDLEVSPEEQRRTIDEFMARGAPARRGEGVQIAPRLARRLEASSPPAATGGEPKPFQFLREARGEKITPFLTGEHPQTIAVVVSHLPDDRAAAVLSSLSSDLQAEVIQRLIDLDQADPEVVREVERALESRMLEQALAERRRESGIDAVARIVEAAQPHLRRVLLQNLSRHDRRLAERVRPQQFEFDDLERVDDATLAAVFEAAGAEVSRLALAGADEMLIERYLKPLSADEAKRMRREIRRPGPLRLSDIEDAQRAVAEVARRLAVEGEIDLPSGRLLAAA